ncbi:unnamed protein product [Natator depressus]
MPCPFAIPPGHCPSASPTPFPASWPCPLHLPSLPILIYPPILMHPNIYPQLPPPSISPSHISPAQLPLDTSIPAVRPPILPPAVNQPLDPAREEQSASRGEKGPAGRCPGPACGQLDGCGWPWWRGQAWQRGPSSPYCRRIRTSWHRGTTTPRQPGGRRGQQDQEKWEPEGVRAAAAGPPLSSWLWGRGSPGLPPAHPAAAQVCLFPSAAAAPAVIQLASGTPG